LPANATQELNNTLLFDQETGLGYFSIQGLNRESIAVFQCALCKIVGALNSGEEALGTPDALPHYLDRLRELQTAIAEIAACTQIIVQ
jgi:hypothetical protein